MTDKSYAAVIRKVLLKLDIDYCVYQSHIGRGIAPGLLEVEEVDGVDRRAIGNWTTDVFGTHYDTKLPLTAMRAMAGFDSRRGRFIHPRSSFYGDEYHAHLPGMLFPWVDEALEKTKGTEHHTAYAFLSLIKSLRWVILQDAAVMINGGRSHYIFKHYKHVFESQEFYDFSNKMMNHLKANDKNDPNNVGALTDTVLPYVNGNLQNVNMAVNNIDNTVKQLSQEVTCMSQELSVDLCDLKDDINENVNTNIRVINEVFKEELGKNTSIMNDQVKHRLANWNYKLSDSLVQQADEMLFLTNGNDNGSNTMSTNQNQIALTNKNDVIQKDNLNLMSTTNKRSYSDLVDDDNTDNKYQIPDTFASFKAMLAHYNTYIDPMETSGHGSKWRRHLNKAERKRIQRVIRVINAYKKTINRHNFLR